MKHVTLVSVLIPFINGENSFLKRRNIEEDRVSPCLDEPVDTLLPHVLGIDFEEDGICYWKDEWTQVHCDIDMSDSPSFSYDECVNKSGCEKTTMTLDIKCSPIFVEDDIALDVDFRVRNVLACQDKSCNVEELAKTFEDSLVQADQAPFSSEWCNVTVAGISKDEDDDDDEECAEGAQDSFYYVNNNGNDFYKSCRWLSKQKPTKKQVICNSVYRSSAEHETPSSVCPMTCCRCDEKAASDFLKQKIENEEGELVEIKSMKCRKLASKDEYVVGKHCDNTESTGTLLPASSVCPKTCESCGDVRNLFGSFIF